eukprot:CAMPEP_0196133716 /NCGR_PEP_ID=MMETSP0910-20130528/2822_1 /TAXON_ID=49265 /ORGANISM="Thalassiosira rotula, Strain GSO102" /LENGTH=165 /DNA_ID=CAMNT_0041393467 /DNA_START=391 /DNA_END=888 /DNA_ORIENTATION=+
MENLVDPTVDFPATKAAANSIASIVMAIVEILLGMGVHFPSSSCRERAAPARKKATRLPMIQAPPSITPFVDLAPTIHESPSTCPIILIRTTFRQVRAVWRSCFALPEEDGAVFLQALLALARLALSEGPKFMSDNPEVARSTAISAFVHGFRMAFVNRAADTPV